MHRHADSLGLLHACCIPGNLHSAVLWHFCVLHKRPSVSYHIYVICTKHKFDPLWLFRRHSSCNIKSGANRPIQVFLSQQGLTQAVKVHLFSFSIFSRVCAISFVSSLPLNKSWDHKKLGLDNSHNEWEWERREQWREIERDYRKLSSQQTVIFFDVTFYKARCFPLICLAKGDHQLLCFSGRCKVAAEKL